jgi:hypothetical protein
MRGACGGKTGPVAELGLVSGVWDPGLGNSEWQWPESGFLEKFAFGSGWFHLVFRLRDEASAGQVARFAGVGFMLF